VTATTTPRTLAPADAADVAATLRACADEGAAIVARGGGTLQSLGNAPARCDAFLSLEHLRGLADYDPRDLTAGILAGTTLAEIARALGEHGQHLPFDAPLPDRATIGGTIAAGWAGPRRGRYGRPRDLLIGSTVALVDGTLAHAGGMVVKNVTGYDMSKAYAGSLGTLAIIVRANVKAVPRPAARRLAVAPIPPDVSDRAIAALGLLAIEPSTASAMPRRSRTRRAGSSSSSRDRRRSSTAQPAICARCSVRRASRKRTSPTVTRRSASSAA
jgi:glycolate oxidase FAD binding subunit